MATGDTAALHAQLRALHAQLSERDAIIAQRDAEISQLRARLGMGAGAGMGADGQPVSEMLVREKMAEEVSVPRPLQPCRLAATLCRATAVLSLMHTLTAGSPPHGPGPPQEAGGVPKGETGAL